MVWVGENLVDSLALGISFEVCRVLLLVEERTEEVNTDFLPSHATAVVFWVVIGSLVTLEV